MRQTHRYLIIQVLLILFFLVLFLGREWPWWWRQGGFGASAAQRRMCSPAIPAGVGPVPTPPAPPPPRSRREAGASDHARTAVAQEGGLNASVKKKGP